MRSAARDRSVRRSDSARLNVQIAIVGNIRVPAEPGLLLAISVQLRIHSSGEFECSNDRAGVLWWQHRRLPCIYDHPDRSGNRYRLWPFAANPKLTAIRSVDDQTVDYMFANVLT